MLLGLVFALVVRFSGALNFCLLGDLIKWRLGLFFFVAAAACLGGLIGSIAGTWIERQVARTFERFAKLKSDRRYQNIKRPSEVKWGRRRGRFAGRLVGLRLVQSIASLARHGRTGHSSKWVSLRPRTALPWLMGLSISETTG